MIFLLLLEKNVRLCTNHHLSIFISCNNVAPSFRTFISRISSVVIINNIHEGLKVPEWMKAFFFRK